MSRESVMIIITDNSWLYAGLASLLPDIVSIHLRFNAKLEHDIMTEDRRIFVLIDSRIVLSNAWESFTILRKSKPDCTTIWLTGGETEKIFPKEFLGEIILSQNLKLVSLQQVLRQTMQISAPLSQEFKARNISLTSTEKYLLPFFVSHSNIHLISRLTGKPVKTLYTHRQNILTKTGFRHAAFLQLVYKRTHWLPGM